MATRVTSLFNYDKWPYIMYYYFAILISSVFVSELNQLLQQNCAKSPLKVMFVDIFVTSEQLHVYVMLRQC